MQETARNIESPRLSLGYGTVAGCNGHKIIVQTPAGQMKARRAASCLLVPAAGDQVLLSEDNFGRVYVLSILERPDHPAENQIALDGATRLTVAEGDLTIVAEKGVTMASPAHVSLSAGELQVQAARADIGLDETTVAGTSLNASFERIRTMARSMDTFIKSWVQRMSSCFRYVREVDETQAASARQLVEGTLTVQTGNSVHIAEGHVKIDAEQIHLG